MLVFGGVDAQTLEIQTGPSNNPVLQPKIMAQGRDPKKVFFPHLKQDFNSLPWNISTWRIIPGLVSG